MIAVTLEVHTARMLTCRVARHVKAVKRHRATINDHSSAKSAGNTSAHTITARQGYPRNGYVRRECDEDAVGSRPAVDRQNICAASVDR